jgi:predicted AAA+ superfamily ATPase
MEPVLRQIFLEWQAKRLPELVPRDVHLGLAEEIVAVIGPRRAGKTYFMYQTAQELLDKGYTKKNIVYLDFEDYRFLNLGDYSLLETVIYELFEEKEGRIVLLLDEVQNLEEWERWLRTLHNKQRYYIVISGSSSKLLAKEIATSLRGRYLNKIILPFSFKEFIRFKHFSLEYRELPEHRGRLLNLLREYLEFGGFPEVVKKEDAREKVDLLRTYFETIFYRDIVDRHKIRNVSLIDTFVKHAFASFGKYFSLSKTERHFKSLGMRVSKKTLATYLKYLEEAFFIFTLDKLSPKLKERVQQPKKVYGIDTGFYTLNPTFSEDIGIKMENLVAIELLKKRLYNPLVELFYWKDYAGNEVDFVLKDGTNIKQLIQVTYASTFNEIGDRELTALRKAGNELNCNDLVVLTWDYEAVGENGIMFIPLWKWLLLPLHTL